MLQHNGSYRCDAIADLDLRIEASPACSICRWFACAIQKGAGMMTGLQCSMARTWSPLAPPPCGMARIRRVTLRNALKKQPVEIVGRKTKFRWSNLFFLRHKCAARTAPPPINLTVAWRGRIRGAPFGAVVAAARSHRAPAFGFGGLRKKFFFGGKKRRGKAGRRGRHGETGGGEEEAQEQDRRLNPESGPRWFRSFDCGW